MRLTDLLRSKNIIDDTAGLREDSDRRPIPLTRNGETMKLIPWEDIWTSLRVARIRGHGEMIEVFYDTLFKEAVFDDYGAWSGCRKAVDEYFADKRGQFSFEPRSRLHIVRNAS